MRLAGLAALLAALLLAAPALAQEPGSYVILQRADLTIPTGITLAADVSRVVEDGDTATVWSVFVFHDPTTPVAGGAAYVEVKSVFTCSSRQVTATVAAAFGLDGSAKPAGATSPPRAVAGPFEPLYGIACNGQRPPDGARRFEDAAAVDADVRERVREVGELMAALAPGQAHRMLALGTLENSGNTWAFFLDRASLMRGDREVKSALLTVFETPVEGEAFRIEWVRYDCEARKMETLAKAGYGADGKMRSLQIREGEMTFDASSAAAAMRAAACAADDLTGAQSFPTYDAALAAAREAIRLKRAGT